jgi:hypothetical protein
MRCGVGAAVSFDASEVMEKISIWDVKLNQERTWGSEHANEAEASR